MADKQFAITLPDPELWAFHARRRFKNIGPDSVYTAVLGVVSAVKATEPREVMEVRIAELERAAREVYGQDWFLQGVQRAALQQELVAQVYAAAAKRVGVGQVAGFDLV